MASGYPTFKPGIPQHKASVPKKEYSLVAVDKRISACLPQNPALVTRTGHHPMVGEEC